MCKNNSSSYVKVNSKEIQTRILEIIKHIKEFNKNIDENIREFFENETKIYNNEKRFLFFKRKQLNAVEFKKYVIIEPFFRENVYKKYQNLESQKYKIYTLSEILDLISMNSEEIFLCQKHVSEIIIFETKFNLTYDKSEYNPQTDHILRG